MITDIRGHALTGATDKSLAHYEMAAHQLTLFSGDPVSTIDAAIAESPDFVMAHALRAWLHLLSSEAGAVPVARDALNKSWELPATAREKAHLAAIELLANGRWTDASRVLEDIAIEHPRDLLALQVGHQLDFFRGDSRLLRDRIARAMPVWSEKVPGYHAVLGMRAFGLEEMGDYVQAEKLGRCGVELERRDGWAQHAVAHVLEMQNRQQEGISWMEQSSDDWSRDSFFAVHNWWHLALYYLELGDIRKVLDLYDRKIYANGSKIALEMVDASAMLWRLKLRGIDVGDRWETLADAWEPMAEAGNYAFNDVHAVMAFVGADRRHAISRVLDSQARAMRGTGDNVIFTRDVGNPVVKALVAFGDNRFSETIDLLRPVRNIAARFGGSHAQRDVLDLTLIEAALRSEQQALAYALIAERDAMRHESPLTQLFVRRAINRQKAA
jgi:tetratricopeptide (TPR) repeat protein